MVVWVPSLSSTLLQPESGGRGEQSEDSSNTTTQVREQETEQKRRDKRYITGER